MSSLNLFGCVEDGIILFETLNQYACECVGMGQYVDTNRKGCFMWRTN